MIWWPDLITMTLQGLEEMAGCLFAIEILVNFCGIEATSLKQQGSPSAYRTRSIEWWSLSYQCPIVRFLEARNGFPIRNVTKGFLALRFHNFCKTGLFTHFFLGRVLVVNLPLLRLSKRSSTRRVMAYLRVIRLPENFSARSRSWRRSPIFHIFDQSQTVSDHEFECKLES